MSDQPPAVPVTVFQPVTGAGDAARKQLADEQKTRGAPMQIMIAGQGSKEMRCES